MLHSYVTDRYVSKCDANHTNNAVGTSFPYFLKFWTEVILNWSAAGAHTRGGPGGPGFQRSTDNCGKIHVRIILGHPIHRPGNRGEGGEQRGAYPSIFWTEGGPTLQLRTVDVVYFYFCLFLHVNLGQSPKNSCRNPGSF